jgi:hypothetical protein
VERQSQKHTQTPDSQVAQPSLQVLLILLVSGYVKPRNGSQPRLATSKRTSHRVETAG